MSLPSPGLAPNHRILVIDDNPSIHDDFRKILGAVRQTDAGLEQHEELVFGKAAREKKQTQFVVDSAFQGKEGLTKVQEALNRGQPYAMAFVDVRMPPGWDGVETIFHLWKECPQLQVVVCTAYSDYSWDEMTQSLGQSDNLVILKKPFDSIEVLQLAHALTQKWFLTQQERIKLDDLELIVQQRTRELADTNAKLVREIEARNQTAEALRLSEERFEKAFHANPLAMAIQTVREERYLDVNESFLGLTGLSRADFLGHTRLELPVLFTAQTWDLVRQQLANNKPVHNLNCQVQPHSGSPCDILLWVELFNLDAEPVMLVIAQDISERIQLESQLRQAKKIEAVGQLAAGVAHDFNNLLTVIQGHANLQLSFDNLDKDIKESLREIATASEKAAHLTRQLLAFGRQQSIRRVPVDINQLLANLRQMISRVLGEHIHLDCDLSETVPTAIGDPGQIEQVIMNLILNARDAMPDGGNLTLCTGAITVDQAYLAQQSEACMGSFVTLSVIDTGTGITPTTLERIFEPFFTTKGVGKGSGMGLAMIHGIMKQHGGWIEVSSQTNQGSTFKLFLPASPATKASKHTPNAGLAMSATASQGMERILVVEDEPAIKILVRTILQKAGYRVVVASDGTEALDIWKHEQGNFQLLLTDCVMPNGVSGRRLAEILVAENATLKVIFTTGYNSETVGNASELREGFNLLTKPYVPQKLLQTVRTRLDH